MNNAPEAYETHALKFTSIRDKSNIGATVVEQWARGIQHSSAVIDLGCGAGYPLTRSLNNLDLRIWAVDSSPTLVKLFRSRFPHIPVQCATVQEFDFFGRTYDAAIAIGLIFLLSEADQIDLISKVSKALNVGGRLLFSAPYQIASWEDICAGCDSRSLGQIRYEEILSEAGF